MRAQILTSILRGGFAPPFVTVAGEVGDRREAAGVYVPVASPWHNPREQLPARGIRPGPGEVRKGHDAGSRASEGAAARRCFIGHGSHAR